MVGHTIYHLEKGSSLTSISMIGHTIYHPGKGSALTSDPVRKAHQLYLIMWESIPQSYQNGFALMSDHVGANPTFISEWLYTYI